MISKDEIIKRLGLQSEEELLSSLDFSDRSDKIKRLSKKNLIPLTDNSKVKVVLEENFEGYFLNNDRSSERRNEWFKRGWFFIAKPDNYIQIKRPKLNNPEGFPKGNVPKGEGSEWYFHRGHTLAHGLSQFLTDKHILLDSAYNVKSDGYWKNELAQDKERNVFTQFGIANKIQAKIEEKVFKLVKEECQNVFYEVSIVKRSKSDKYAIGTEIFYQSLTNPREVGHYFVPNIDKNFEILSEEPDKISYSDFYSQGYRKKYRQYFKNSDRQEWEISENKTVKTGNDRFYLVDSKKVIYNTSEYLEENDVVKEFTINDIDQISEELKGKTFYPVSKCSDSGKEGIYFDWDEAKNQGLSGYVYPKKTKELKEAMSQYSDRSNDLHGMKWI